MASFSLVVCDPASLTPKIWSHKTNVKCMWRSRDLHDLLHWIAQNSRLLASSKVVGISLYLAAWWFATEAWIGGSWFMIINPQWWEIFEELSELGLHSPIECKKEALWEKHGWGKSSHNQNFKGGSRGHLTWVLRLFGNELIHDSYDSYVAETSHFTKSDRIIISSLQAHVIHMCKLLKPEVWTDVTSPGVHVQTWALPKIQTCNLSATM